eukprot:TRINITY_DN820_c3_g1_i6.p1 TRINITY_DN820_c3_g1~~TRINITY_DN820_c3_g1_i6.p1  ORF type:complete len:1139 (-),score=291.44 TRINITY_DN820_c3_g1_i6:390-3713(-)
MAEEYNTMEERVSVEEEAGVGSGGEAAEYEYYDEGAEPIVDEEPVEEEAQQKEQEVTQMTGQSIVTDSFGELVLPLEQSEHLEKMWALMVATVGGRDQVADAIYDTFFNASPALQELWKTPKRVLTFMLFMGINTFMTGTRNPQTLRMQVDSIAMRHTDREVTVPRIDLMRDALVDLIVMTLGSKLTPEAATAAVSVCNYVGGAMIYIRLNFKERIDILIESWKLANDDQKNAERMATQASREMAAAGAGQEEGSAGQGAGTEGGAGQSAKKSKDQQGTQNIPTSFREMFLFNAAVMGFGQSLWMNEILDLLDNVVSNFRSAMRLQEECYVMTIRINKVASGKVNLPEFKSCMLASLRSLLPKEWTTQHEVAWSWCWERIEQTILENLGKPPRWEKALGDLYASIDEATGFQIRQDCYYRFFEISAEGESFFKQNMAYLHLIVTKILAYTMQIFNEPVVACDEISALGLRHVGYAIPIELLMPFKDICVGVVKDVGADEVSLKAFNFALTLVVTMQGRVIAEGSTVVMKAVNINSPSAVRLSITCAARGERASWMLMIKVGTRDISPFLWSVQSGALEAASTMLADLVTIRADRDKYYYPIDALFARHTDLVNVLLQDAPTLVVPLLDGMIWRSRITKNGLRRTNYYMKYLLLDQEGKLHKTLEWIVKARDPKLMVHPMLVLLSDVIWRRVALFSFLSRKMWFIFTLFVFVISQSILKGYNRDHSGEASRIAAVILRLFIYLCSMGQMLFVHMGKIMGAYKSGNTVQLGKLKLPAHLGNWQESFGLFLVFILILMLCTEPILHCMADEDAPLFSDQCKGISNGLSETYYIFNAIAMFLYFVLLLDLAAINNRVSAYGLVCGRMLSEIALFLFSMVGLLLTLSSALSCLEQDNDDFRSIPRGAMAMWDMLLGMYDTLDYEVLDKEPIVRIGVYVYLVVAIIFLQNLLIAQLTCSYDAVYADMVGFARLKRSSVIVETMPTVSMQRWTRFKDGLGLESPIEFNEGDVGVNGGMQVEEPAAMHPTTVDTIKRVGGTTSPLAQWPAESEELEEGDSRFIKIETTIRRALDQVQSGGQKKKTDGGVSSTGDNGSGLGEGSAGSFGAGEEEEE